MSFVHLKHLIFVLEFNIGIDSATSLHTVKLGCNNFGDDGAISLASLLSNNKTITCLDVGFNMIGDR